jgi:tripartite-type tricarboxylate transporter receptor subunit TctC
MTVLRHQLTLHPRGILEAGSGMRNRSLKETDVPSSIWRPSPTRRSVIRSLASLAAAGIAPRAATARSFPDRPIHLVVPSAPGGVFDAVARMWGEKTKPVLKTVVVENQAGAGRGEASVARATPDGYTILLTGLISNIINAVALSKQVYNPMGFAPISILCSNSYAFAINPSLPIRSMQELLDYYRKRPGTLSYGSARVGSLNHLTGELFKHVAKMPDVTHVPYRGAGPALVDVMSGQIPMAVISVTTQMIDLHRTGKIRILAVTSKERLSFAPDIPTTAEAGLAAVDTQQFVGLFAPPQTPRAFTGEMARATQQAVGDPAYRQNLANAGFETFEDASPEKMQEISDQLFKTWAPIIKAIGLKLD